jgi:hypothetical protein
MVREGFVRFVIDLEGCRGLDSTFMGTLLDVSTTAREGAKANKPPKREQQEKAHSDAGVLLVNVDRHCERQLQSVGLDTFVPIRGGETSLPSGIELRSLEIKDVSVGERLRIILKAHQELIAVDSRNRAKFGPFIEGLLADYKAMGPSESTSEETTA